MIANATRVLPRRWQTLFLVSTPTALKVVAEDDIMPAICSLAYSSSTRVQSLCGDVLGAAASDESGRGLISAPVRTCRADQVGVHCRPSPVICRRTGKRSVEPSTGREVYGSALVVRGDVGQAEPWAV